MKMQNVTLRGDSTVVLKRENESHVVLHNESNIVMKDTSVVLRQPTSVVLRQPTSVVLRQPTIVMNRDISVLLKRSIVALSVCLMIVMSLHTVTVVNCYTHDAREEREITQMRIPQFPFGNLEHTCRTMSCPEFKVMKSFPEEQFQMRDYLPTRWISTDVTLLDFDEFLVAQKIALFRLTNYLNGENDGQIKLEASVPMLHHLKSGFNERGLKVMTVSLFLPEGIQVPQPSNSQVYLTRMSEQKIGVLRFPGYIYGFDSTVRPRVEELERVMRRHGYMIDNDCDVFIASYDIPTKLFNRHNEIWIQRKGLREMRITTGDEQSLKEMHIIETDSRRTLPIHDL